MCQNKALSDYRYLMHTNHTKILSILLLSIGAVCVLRRARFLMTLVSHGYLFFYDHMIFVRLQIEYVII
jgi:NADH:ubiquinone oxidoreductase subunit K